MQKERKFMGKKAFVVLWMMEAALLPVVINASIISFYVSAGEDSTVRGNGTGWMNGKKIDDYEIVMDVISTRITLDSLGEVNLVSFHQNFNHPPLTVALAADDGRIFFEFISLCGLEVKVFDVFVEDLDGDGRDDIKIILGFMDGSGWDSYRVENDYYQMKEGGFDTKPEGSVRKEFEPISSHKYSGCYRIGECCPAQSFAARGQGMMTEQEMDMILGSTVVLDKDFILLYNCEKKQGVWKGGDVFSGNHMVQKVALFGVKGQVVSPDCVLEFAVPDPAMEQAVGKERYERINGEIGSNENGTIHFYTMEGKDSIIMESYLSGQYFILEKLKGEEAEKAMREAGVRRDSVDVGSVSEEEKETILTDIYGTYTVREFLPTVYYEGKDDVFLPDGEPGWMIGKKITIGESIFTTYDNYRWSDAGKGKAVGKWFQKVRIQEPDYHLTCRKRWEIFGLRDDMLPEGMEQKEYMEIAVYPGIKMGNDRYLPQMFLLDDGRILMYSMGQYFLLEKDK